MKASDMGSISHGTLRAQDLALAFIQALKSFDYPRAKAFRAEWDALEDTDCEAAGYILHELFDALDEYAPEGCYFGSHPGDGADFGFWPVETAE